MSAFWDIAPCSLADVYAVYISETSVNSYETTRRNIPEGCNLHSHRRGNLKSHQINICLNEGRCVENNKISHETPFVSNGDNIYKQPVWTNLVPGFHL
jgi:hypothetical protein